MDIIQKISKSFSQLTPIQLLSKSIQRPMKDLPIPYQPPPISSESRDDHQVGSGLAITPLPEIDCIIFLLSISGARISEVLNIIGSDIPDSQTIIIRGLKRSASRMIRVPELEPLLSAAMRLPDRPLFHHNYLYVYRSCLARGIFVKHLRSHNRSVTHSLRYAKISQLSVVTENTKIIADCIGHRTKRTTQNYLSKR